MKIETNMKIDIWEYRIKVYLIEVIRLNFIFWFSKPLFKSGFHASNICYSLDDRFRVTFHHSNRNSNYHGTPYIRLWLLLWLAGPRRKSEEKNASRRRRRGRILNRANTPQFVLRLCLCFLSFLPSPFLSVSFFTPLFIPPFRDHSPARSAASTRYNAEVSLWDREIHRSTNVSRGKCTPEMSRVSGDRAGCKFESKRVDRRHSFDILS